MNDKPTKSELLAMLAEAVRNTQPQIPAPKTQLDVVSDEQPKLKRARRAPKPTRKARHVPAVARRKPRR